MGYPVRPASHSTEIPGECKRAPRRRDIRDFQRLTRLPKSTTRSPESLPAETTTGQLEPPRPHTFRQEHSHPRQGIWDLRPYPETG